MIYQGQIALNGSTKIICTTPTMHISKIVITNTLSNYTLSVCNFMTGPGLHEIPLYSFQLDQGDVVHDSNSYFLKQGNYIELKTDVIGTTYYVNSST